MRRDYKNESRRIFLFKSGMEVHVYYHHAFESWGATAWVGGIHIGATDLHLGIGSASATIKYLRSAIARKKDPRFDRVHSQMIGESKMASVDVEENGKITVTARGARGEKLEASVDLAKIVEDVASKVNSSFDQKALSILAGLLK